MNKQTILFSILSVALLSLTACSNDNNRTIGNEINAAQSIKFKVDFADYNSEQEVDVTRTTLGEVKLERRIVDLGNGILAQCTLQRDTTRQDKPATRVIPNDTYTMLAYDNATHTFKGALTGTVAAGVFTSTSANKGIILEASKTYDFVLFNSKVSRNGDNLTVTRGNADAALIGRTTQTIAAMPHEQKITFTLKHVAAKVKIKLTGYMHFSGVTATLASVNTTDVPTSSVYDASTGTWTIGAGAAVSENLTYGNSIALSGANAGKYAVNSTKETIFMPSTDISKLKLNFTAGNIYNIAMASAGLTFNPSTPLQLEQNGSYVLNINLMYRFLYLMNNGDIGTIEDTPYGGSGGTKIPIAVVLSRSKRMAIALKDANNGAITAWCSNAYRYVNTNVHMVGTGGVIGDYMNNALVDALSTNGKDETWEASYSTGSIGVKATNPAFPAFNAAASYVPGITYTGLPEPKWYLPSYSDWKWVFSALGFGDKTSVTRMGEYSWYGNLASVAFTQVGGTALALNKYYWSSSECWGDYGSRHAGIVQIKISSMFWTAEAQFRTYHYFPIVRAFVAY